MGVLQSAVPTTVEMDDGFRAFDWKMQLSIVRPGCAGKTADKFDGKNSSSLTQCIVNGKITKLIVNGL
jgi:hypothetical protein